MESQILTFEKEHDNNWYVVLPEWDGDHSELQMICGADTMLDIISQGELSVRIVISELPIDRYNFKLDYDYDENGGAWYKLSSNLHNFNVWLCHITKFVFGHLPMTIYIK